MSYLTPLQTKKIGKYTCVEYSKKNEFGVFYRIYNENSEYLATVYSEKFIHELENLDQ